MIEINLTDILINTLLMTGIILPMLGTLIILTKGNFKKNTWKKYGIISTLTSTFFFFLITIKTGAI